VRAESEEMDRSGELDSSCSLATSEMQYIQVPVESVKTAVNRMRTVAKLKHMTLLTWSLAS
jgi:hypothetical protein